MARVLSWGVFSFILSSTRFAAPAQAGQPAQTLLAALSQRALAALFRDKFLVGLSQMLDEEELHLPDSRHRRHAPADSELLYAKRWVLYDKRPFGGPHQSYLAKYTQRAAQSTHYRHRCEAADRHLHLSRLPARFTAQGVNPLGPGVHPALQLADSAFGTGAHPAL
jgi:hypothetical protein